jgi:hypothetical protein
MIYKMIATTLLTATCALAGPVSDEMRYLHADPGAARTNAWQTLYTNTRGVAMGRITSAGELAGGAVTPAHKQLRIIGELTSPLSHGDAMRVRLVLDDWADRNYNALLCVWYGETDISDLADVMTHARATGFATILVIGTQGPWDIAHPSEIDPRFAQWDATPYHDLDVLSATLDTLAPLADYLLPLWRGSAPGHWWDFYLHKSRGDPTSTIEPDLTAMSDYADTVARLARASNGDVRIIGIVQRLTNCGYQTQPWAWVPDYADVVLVMGVSQQRRGIDIWPRSVRAWVTGVIGRESPPVIIGPVFGPGPYWWHNAQRTAGRGLLAATHAPNPLHGVVHRRDAPGKTWQRLTNPGNALPSPASGRGRLVATTPAGTNAWQAWQRIKPYAASWGSNPDNLRQCGYEVTYDADEHRVRAHTNGVTYRVRYGADCRYDSVERHPPKLDLDTIDTDTEATVDWVLTATNVFGAVRLVGDGSGPRNGNSDRIGYHDYPWPD